MKKVILLSAAFICCSVLCHSQSLANSKMITVKHGFSRNNSSYPIYVTSPITTFNDKGFTTGIEVSYGKINSRNLLLAGGIGFSTSLLKMKETSGITREGGATALFPFFLVQKFKSIGRKFYYTPSAMAGINFIHRNFNNDNNSKIIQQNTTTGGFAKMNPISFSYQPGKRFIAGLSMGEYSFGIQKNKITEVNTTATPAKNTVTEHEAGLSWPVYVSLQFKLGK